MTDTIRVPALVMDWLRGTTAVEDLPLTGARRYRGLYRLDLTRAQTLELGDWVAYAYAYNRSDGSRTGVAAATCKAASVLLASLKLLVRA